MKRILLICFVLLILAIGCKSRKLSTQENKSVDKTKTEQTSDVKQETTTQVGRTEATTSTISDQSGTWIWEEWYQKTKDADTVISDFPIYKRTTFIKNNIQKTESKEVEEFENHSEITDSVGSLITQKDISEKSKSKELEAVKESPASWIWPLFGLILVIAAFLLIRQRR